MKIMFSRVAQTYNIPRPSPQSQYLNRRQFTVASKSNSATVMYTLETQNMQKYTLEFFETKTTVGTAAQIDKPSQFVLQLQASGTYDRLRHVSLPEPLAVHFLVIELPPARRHSGLHFSKLYLLQTKYVKYEFYCY